MFSKFGNTPAENDNMGEVHCGFKLTPKPKLQPQRGRALPAPSAFFGLLLYHCNDTIKAIADAGFERCTMTRVLSLYHGSEHVVEHPDLAHGKPHNDYGRGFYCTEDHAMACEWACKQGTDGFANEYELDASNLRILDLNGGGYTTLHWIALLLANRTFSLSSELAQDARAYLLDRFLVDMEGCDLVRGYRADDSYFAYAEAFVENGLSLRQLNTALHLGKLGEQVALVSDKAFISLSFVGATPAPAAVYYPRFKQRDQTARSEYRTRVRGGASYRDDLFILDILRQEMTPDDPRLQ